MIAEVFLTSRQAKLIVKIKFTIVDLDLENKAFIVYIAFISQDSNIYST